MLLQGFTGFDDVIIVLVTSQPQNIYFLKILQKLASVIKKSHIYHVPISFLDRGANLPVQIGVKITR